MSHYTMLSKQAENRLFLQIESGRILDILWAFLIKTIMPLALVGYEMIIANSGLRASLFVQKLINNS